MYAIYKQVHPPTGIEHCLNCNFFSPSTKNLVIAGVNQLHVYRLKGETQVPSQAADKKNGGDVRAKKKKLECLASFELFGNIQSMQSVRLAGSSRDAILLSFMDAKLSLVEYDPGSHDLKTSSLHYFEDDDLKDGHTQHSFHLPVIRVDPEARCAAMLTFGTRLVILPFSRDTGTSLDDPDGLLGESKPPIMSSYIIDLRHLDEKIINVIDLQFLHGYYEPTIFILYEPLPTWAGRVAMRKDSCSIVAISLNLQQRVHPIIWSLGSLPFDCTQVVPVPKPIGGVLIFAVNSLLYLNQSFPPYGVALNSLTNFSSDFLLKAQEGMKITLDCAQACLISHDKLVISMKGGELYVLTLIVDSMRAVRGLHLDKAAASVLTTCMCHCEDGHLFLGSRLGNSLLLKYTESSTLDRLGDDVTATTTTTAAAKKDKEEPPAKKKKTDTLGDWIATDVSQLDDLDELEVYGRDVQPRGSSITHYTFEVCDSIMNIGPCSQVVMGEPAFLSEEFSNSVDPDIELVTTSGYSKNGAICVLQRSIRPQVVTTFELPGCVDMWTVFGPRPNRDKPTDGKDDENPTSKDEEANDDTKTGHDEDVSDTSHALLILSRDDSSMVLETGQEIMELDHSGFTTQLPTVYAGNIGDNKYIIQVSPQGVRLLEGVDQLQHIPLDLGSPITMASSADPYVLMCSEAGDVMMLHFRQQTTRLAVIKPQFKQPSCVVALCVYKDVSGLFTTVAMGTGEQEAGRSHSDDGPLRMSFSDSFHNMDASTADDEDELLYGDSKLPSDLPEDKQKKDDDSRSRGQEAIIEPTYWTVLARQNGTLEIYSVIEQTFQLCFLVKNFSAGHKVLVDSGQLAETGSSGENVELGTVKELLLIGLGNNKGRPHLMARIDEEILMYEAFPYNGSASSTPRLQLRFKKVPHGLLLREKRTTRVSGKRPGAVDAPLVVNKWLRYFDDICGYSGVFICGPYPHWLYMTNRGCLRIHPMGIDTAITCMAPFDNVNCPKGCLYFNRQGELRICALPTHLSYDAPWPVRKVPLRCTPHFVVYHPDSKTYAVVTSSAEPCNQLVVVAAEGEKEFEVLTKDDRYIFPMIDKFSVQLFSPVSWEPVPNTKFEYEEFEHISCIKNVTLTCEGTLSGFKGYIAVGTSYSYNEEVTSRGRIVIYEVNEVVPEPGQPLTKNKMKIEYDKEQKGPVTALDHVLGYLVTAIGQKVYIWQLKEKTLSGVAFIDTQIYIHSICTVKSLILIADLCKSITVLRYQENTKVLSRVSHDKKPLEVYSAAFMVDNQHLNFLASDRMKNLLIYTYQPEVRESNGGQYLIRRADINVGSHVNTFFRVRCKLTDPSTQKQLSGVYEKRHITYFATLDGAICFLLPVNEKMYRRLLMLQNALNTHIPHVAGLNPKSFRMVRNEYRTLTNPRRNILDGQLLWRFLHLGMVERRDLAKRIGTSTDQIIDDLTEVDRITAHF